MIDDDTLRTELDRVTAAAPGVGFTAADVVRRGRRRRRLRQGTVLGGAAVALVLVVGVPTVVLGGPGDPAPVGTAGPTSPARSTPAPTGPTPTGAPAPVVPGVSAAEAARIAAGCGRSFGGAGGRVNPTPAPGGSQGPRVQDAVTLYNLVRDAAGAHALLYGAGVMLSCQLDGPQGKYNAGGGYGIQYPYWMPGPMALEDRSGSGPDGDFPGFETFAGRVRADVTEVEVSSGGQRSRVPVRNGTFLVRQLKPAGWDPGSATAPVVTAYDRDGDVVVRLPGEPDAACYATPDGTVVYGRRSGTCARATRWP